MATVFVPTMLQSLTNGVKQIEVDASNIRQIIDQLDRLYPGMKDRLVEDGRIRRNLAVSIDGEIARLGLLEKVEEHSEVHFVPAIGGGICGNLSYAPPDGSTLTGPYQTLTMSKLTPKPDLVYVPAK